MDWYNEPPAWHEDGDTITVTSGPGTDFWRLTHYGFVHDNGHVYYRQVSGDFSAEVMVSGAYKDQYDQAGLMLRVDETTWLKCGIEFVDGVQQVSAVVTREYSDWSVAPLAQNPPTLRLRLVRRGSAVEVHYALDGTDYTLLRIAYFPPAETVWVGVTCASPAGSGFPVTFKGFTVQATAATA